MVSRTQGRGVVDTYVLCCRLPSSCLYQCCSSLIWLSTCVMLAVFLAFSIACRYRLFSFLTFLRGPFFSRLGHSFFELLLEGLRFLCQFDTIWQPIPSLYYSDSKGPGILWCNVFCACHSPSPCPAVFTHHPEQCLVFLAHHTYSTFRAPRTYVPCSPLLTFLLTVLTFLLTVLTFLLTVLTFRAHRTYFQSLHYLHSVLTVPYCPCVLTLPY